jgi:ELWxxDGT repeat protein
MVRFLFITSLVSVFAIGCGDDKDTKGAPNDGGADGAGTDAITEGGGIDVGPAPTGFDLVADLNTRHDSALTPYDQRFYEAAGKIFFVGEDGVHGLEPMVSDGTAAGTKLLKDLAPGIDDGGAGGFITKGDKIYFFGKKDTTIALYRSDGTTEGTTPIINDGQGGDSTHAFRVGEKLCFLDRTLRCTDPAITALTKISDTPSSSGPAMSVGALGVFSIDRALWSTDGVTATKLVDVEIKRGGVVIDGKAIFWAEYSGQMRPYMSDGTLAGSRPLADITTSGDAPPMIALGSKVLTIHVGESVILDPVGLTPTKLTDLYTLGAIGIGGGKALLWAERRSASPSIGSELWITDGTDAGTRLVRELNPGSSGSSIKWLGTIGGSAYFIANDSGLAIQRLYKSDGTDAGTVKLGDWTVDLSADRPGFTTAPFGLAFRCADATSWKTLCTLDASGKVTVIPVNAATAPSIPNSFVTAGDRLFFNANDGAEPGSYPSGSMFVSDGTAAGTKRVGVRFGGQLASLGLRTFFTRVAPDGTDKWELASFDADPATVTSVAVFNYKSNLDYARPYPLVAFSGKVWFAANGTSGSLTVHSSDGTPTGTKSMFRTPSAGYAEYGGAPWPVVGPAMYVPTTDGIQVVDATGTMTPLGAAPGKIGAIDAAEGRIWFSVGGTLWITDGTAAGTTQVKAVTTSTSNPIWRIVAIKSNFAYVFTGSGSSPAVYSSDGTATGTKLVASMPGWTRFRDGLAFAGSSGVAIVSPSKPVPIVLGAQGSKRLLGAGERLFFATYDDKHGEELWLSDGTTLGTRLAGDLRDGKQSSSPTPHAVVGSHVYFSADDGAHGHELWRYRLAP